MSGDLESMLNAYDGYVNRAEELRQKENIMSLLRFGAFSKIVFLSDRTKIGQVSKISEVGEFLDT